MFSLFYGLWKYWFRKDEYYVLILGLDNAGKTTFLERAKQLMVPGYKGMQLDRISPTVGMNVGRIDVGAVRMIFWDVGGQQDLQTLWDKYYSECHAVIYVLDSSDQALLEDSKVVLDRVLENSLLRGLPFLIVANKQDIQGCLAVRDIRGHLSSCNLTNRDCLVQGICSLGGDGIREGIEWLVQCVQLNTSARPPHLRQIS